MNVNVTARYPITDGQLYKRVKLSDGRVCLEHRYLIEQSLGRRLSRAEHVHHIDGDKSNNVLSNLELISPERHTAQHKAEIPTAIVYKTCEKCGKLYIRRRGQSNEVPSRRHHRSFCSRRCSGAFSGLRRNGNDTQATLVKHGTKTRYSYYKCRCALCREANRKAQEAYRHKG